MNRGRQRAEWRARLRQQRLALHEQRPAPLRTPNSTSVHLRINELVFQGFPKSTARRIASVFELELTALLQARSLPAAWRTGTPIDHVRTAPLRPHSLTDTRGVGEQLARAIFAMQARGRKSETTA
jgi:hypothetical protein